MFVTSITRQRTAFSACLMLALLGFSLDMALARSTDQQANASYELVTSGCVVKNDIPFFKGPPGAVSRQETGGAVDEKRQYGKSEVRTHSEYGKLFIEQLTVSADSVPDELKS